MRAKFERDQDGGACHSAHVPRRRPSAAASSFTSLRGTPHRPDQAPPWHAITRTMVVGPRASGDRRSEVKEEEWAQPIPGDMSGACPPMPEARSSFKTQTTTMDH